jgi:hypothetical protein
VAPLIVQAVATLVARVFLPWLDAVRASLVVMFLFTASAHFTRLRHDLAAMIPPPFTGAMWLIYLTGVLELAGADCARRSEIPVCRGRLPRAHAARSSSRQHLRRANRRATERKASNGALVPRASPDLLDSLALGRAVIRFPRRLAAYGSIIIRPNNWQRTPNDLANRRAQARRSADQ